MTKRKCGDERVYEQKCNDVSREKLTFADTTKNQTKSKIFYDEKHIQEIQP